MSEITIRKNNTKNRTEFHVTGKAINEFFVDCYHEHEFFSPRISISDGREKIMSIEVAQDLHEVLGEAIRIAVSLQENLNRGFFGPEQDKCLDQEKYLEDRIQKDYTVREIFEMICGPLPEGATCHVGRIPGVPVISFPTAFNVQSRKVSIERICGWFSNKWDDYGPLPHHSDISDRDAEAFRGFFGPEYDQCLDMLTQEKAEKQDQEKDLENRIQNALKIANKNGQTDGGHHKMWVIDSMVRVLLGGVQSRGGSVSKTPEYTKWVEEYEDGEDGPQTYEWDAGIIP